MPAGYKELTRIASQFFKKKLLHIYILLVVPWAVTQPEGVFGKFKFWNIFQISNKDQWSDY